MDARVILNRKGEIRTKGRVVCLIIDKLLLCREGQVLKAIRLLQPIGIKAVSACKDRAHFVKAGYRRHGAPILPQGVVQALEAFGKDSCIDADAEAKVIRHFKKPS